MKALDNIHGGRMPLLIAVGITMIMLLLASGIGTAKGESEIEIAYDDGSAEGYWSIGSMYDYSDWYNGGRSGHAVSFSPCSYFFSIDSIKVFGRRDGDDSKIRIEVWDQNRNIVYSNISNSSDYFSTTLSWAYIDVSSIDISGDFYVVLFTGSTMTDGTSIGYDTSSSINRSYVVRNNTEFIWTLSSPQETTNWMIRVVGREEDTQPSLTIISPTNGSIVTTPIITVTGTATDDTGVTTLTVNGNPITLESDGSFSTTVSLASGVNTITVVATDVEGNSATETVTVTYSAPAPYLVFAITPNSRLAQVNSPVTIFLSSINAGTATATDVSISQDSSLPATISYQMWDGATLTGTPNTPVDIGSGEIANFVMTITPTAEFASSSMTFDVSSTNGANAPISGVNTLTLSASSVPYADVIMISTALDVSTPVKTPTAFAIATTNVGTADATGVNLVMDIPQTIDGLSYEVYETYPNNGSIKGPATGLTISVGAQPTFAVFLTPTEPITFDPANNRIMLKLVDGIGTVVGAQSVSVSTT